MRYRYLRSYANSPLGRACALVTGEHFPVVRAGNLAPASLMKTPLPEGSRAAKGLEECVRERADQLLSAHDKLCVVWSGGLDSSVAASALLSARRPGQRIVLGVSEVSVKDSPTGLLTEFIDSGAEPVELTREKVLGLLSEGFFFVDGSQADLIHFTDEWITLRGLDYEQCLLYGPEELTKLRSGATDADVAVALHHLRPLLELMPPYLEKTGHAVHWWVGFTSLWDFDLYEMPMVFGYPVSRSYCFFDSEEFQRWALQPVELKRVAGDRRSKAALHKVASTLLGRPFDFVKNTTTVDTPGPTLEGIRTLLETDFLYIAEDLSYVVRQ